MQKVPYTVKDCARDDEKSIVVPPCTCQRHIHLVVSDNGDRPLRIGQTQGMVCKFLHFFPLLSAGDSGSLQKASAKCAVPFNALRTSIAQSPKLVNCFLQKFSQCNPDIPQAFNPHRMPLVFPAVPLPAGCRHSRRSSADRGHTLWTARSNADSRLFS